MNTGLHIHICVFLFMPRSSCFCINDLASKPDLNSTDEKDNAGQSYAASVARRVGGIG